MTHIGIGAILVLVLAAAFVYLSFDIGKRVDKIKESRSSLDFHSQIAELLFALRADFNAVSPYILGIENILPSRDDFLKTVENSRYSIKLNALDLSRRDNDYRGLLNGKVFYF